MHRNKRVTLEQLDSLLAEAFLPWPVGMDCSNPNFVKSGGRIGYFRREGAFGARPQKDQDEAYWRAKAVALAMARLADRMWIDEKSVFKAVSREIGCGARSLWRWKSQVVGIPREGWHLYLVSQRERIGPARVAVMKMMVDAPASLKGHSAQEQVDAMEGKVSLRVIQRLRKNGQL